MGKLDKLCALAVSAALIVFVFHVFIIPATEGLHKLAKLIESLN